MNRNFEGGGPALAGSRETLDIAAQTLSIKALDRQPLTNDINGLDHNSRSWTMNDAHDLHQIAQ